MDTFSEPVQQLIIIQAFTLVSSLIALGVQLYREKRNRQWQRDDTASKIAMATKLEENTVLTQQTADIAQAGFAETNGTTEKIELKVNDLNRRVPSSAIRCGDVAAIVEQRQLDGRWERRNADSRVIVERQRRTDEPSA